MLPETIILAMVCYYMGTSLDFSLQIPKRIKRSVLPFADWARLAGGGALLFGLIFDVTKIFAKIQNSETGEFDLTALTGAPFSFFLPILIVSLVAFLVFVACMVGAKVAEKKNPAWWEEIAKIKEFVAQNEAKQIGTLTPYEVIETVNSYLGEESPVATDVGQHQMWTAQKYRFEKTRTFMTSGGLGTMGYGMGGAIGACVATGKRTVLFTGDGSFGMNLNELATAVSQKLPLIIVVLNNGVLGMVRQWQAAFYNRHFSETTLERKTDFAALARAFGASGFTVETLDELNMAMKMAVKNNGPVLIDCAIDMDERVLPMIPPGGAIENMILS
jgi:acetolactate synthase-1/2/3 large subunit